ncbi:MAG: enoyl-CoA hydratase [Deltaproteobacteria bacterium]|nr:enoyl-CoA hydratase [Deltaproteobacteria bacterium]
MSITVEDRGAVRTVRIARPEKKNALTLAMYESLAKSLAEYSANPELRACVLLGSPGIFTAGNDIGDFMQNPPTGEDSPVFGFLIALADCPKPVIAAVDGAAVGVGTTMLLHCDLVIASSRAKFSMPFVSLGLVPEGASSVLLPQIVGRATAAQWLMTGESFTADSALRSGLISEVHAPDELEARAIQLAETIAAKPVEAMRLTKELVRGPQRALVRDALSREGKLFIERLSAPETMAAFMSFMQKKS